VRHDLSNHSQQEARSYVAAYMHFPESHAKAKKAYYYFCIDNAAESTKVNVLHDSFVTKKQYEDFGIAIGRMLHNELGYQDFINTTIISKSNDFLGELFRRRFMGFITGLIYFLLAKKRGSISEAIKLISTMYLDREKNGEVLPCNMSTRNIRNNIWPQYRPVVHLWAALVAFGIMRPEHYDDIRPESENFLFCPHLDALCLSEDLPQLLSLADYFLQEGAAMNLSRRGPAQPFLDLANAEEFSLGSD